VNSHSLKCFFIFILLKELEEKIKAKANNTKPIKVLKNGIVSRSIIECYLEEGNDTRIANDK